MKIIQLININLEMKNIGIIVYGRFPTEKAYGSHIIDIANGFLEKENFFMSSFAYQIFSFQSQAQNNW